ncbi:MAG TPA: hypothetical protein VG734_03325 [Lacunisphaera sp.]|nr:hypothetical protein [Lacunisphaera sp.]
MKTTQNILTALIAAGTPGAAVLAVYNQLPADLILGGLTALGLVAFAIYDFSRTTASLKVSTAVIRPRFTTVASHAPVVVRKAA